MGPTVNLTKAGAMKFRRRGKTPATDISCFARFPLAYINRFPAKSRNFTTQVTARCEKVILVAWVIKSSYRFRLVIAFSSFDFKVATEALRNNFRIWKQNFAKIGEKFICLGAIRNNE